MKTQLVGAIACIMAALTTSQANPQSKAAIINQKRDEAKGQNMALEQDLSSHFSLTWVDDQNGTVKGQGRSYSVLKAGIHAIPIQGNYYWPNYYFKNGRVRQPIVQESSSSSADGSTTTVSIGLRLPLQPNASRRVGENEQVYITEIDVQGRTASFFLQTCTQNFPVSRARLDVHFATKNLTDADLNEVLGTISQLLADPNAPPLSPAEVMASDIPHPQDLANSASYMVHPGMTQVQVKSMLGDPQKIKHERQGSLFLYEGFAIQFEGDSVTTVSPH